MSHEIRPPTNGILGMAQLRLPIVALTAGVYAEDRERCLAAGMDDFLAKPVDIRDLRTRIDKWTEKTTPTPE